MHKRETFKIVAIMIVVLAVIVINALIFTKKSPSILDIPETQEAKKPVPDFSVYTDVKQKKAAFFDYLRPEVEKQNSYILTLRHYVQTLYRKAVDADQALDHLQKDQKGKFAAVFTADSPFNTSSKRFGPYVEEIAQDWQALKAMSEEEAKAALPLLIKKIELALVTIAQFQSTLSKK